MKLKIGDKLRKTDGTLYHVRGFVDDVVVLRFWIGHKKRWAYEVQRPEWWPTGYFTKV